MSELRKPPQAEARCAIHSHHPGTFEARIHNGALYVARKERD